MADPTPWIAAEAPVEGARRHAPATLRNRAAIAGVLAGVLPVAGDVLEVASGSGEHCAFLAECFPALRWHPSDPEPEARRSIDAWCAGLGNVAPALALDAAADDWPVGRADAVLCVNMIHIAPWAATEGLMRGAARVLGAGAPLVLYGPFRRAGVPTATSNEAFDASLRARDPRWGLRELEAVVDAAIGFALAEVREMPANNLMVVLRRA